MKSQRENRCLLFDWGDTLMRVFPEYAGPMASWPQVEAVEHAVETLAGLREGWTLALATNAEASDEAEIRAALQRVELDRYLDKIYCFRTIGHKKPSPAFFTYILESLRIDPSQAVLVGDDFKADVLGANSCGIRAVWLNRRSDEDRRGDHYRTIHDLRNLKAALETF